MGACGICETASLRVDGKSCDLIEPAYDRYARGHRQRHAVEVWKFNRQVPTVAIGTRLRIQANSPFLLHWTSDEWMHFTDTRSIATGFDIESVDLRLPEQKTTIRFTFLWVYENRWEGKDYKFELQDRGHSQEDVRVASNSQHRKSRKKGLR